jgi:thiamine biosynthesis lipoprotein
VVLPKIGPKLKRFVLVLFLLPAPAGFPASQEMLRLESSVDAMGSTYSVALYGYDRLQLEAAADAAFDEVRRLDELLSNYKPSSEWSRVNGLAAQGPVRISQELFDLLSACLDYSRKSDGAFDISVGPLMKVWRFYKGSGHLAHKAEVAAALTKVGYRHVHLDPANGTVRFDRSGVELDPGGIGKGYAVDRMVETLRNKGIKIGLVSGSYSSIYGMGAPPNEPRGWQVKIRDPRDERKTVETLYLKDMSLSTSGSYEKFFKAEGKIYSHIMDPRTGYPAPGMLSVSVVAPRTLDSEAWCKPFFINGRSWAAKRKDLGLRAYFCEDRTDQPCAWLQ